MPPAIISKLLDEDLSLQDRLSFEDVKFPVTEGIPTGIKGLDILAGLQDAQREGFLTVFRAVRFPTFKRIHEMLYMAGYAMSNFEQERILTLYRDPDYLRQRNLIKKDPHFWTQAQERVVRGLPIFCLVNDALQIHRAFRGENDRVVIIAIHIPQSLVATRQIKLVANTAIDFDYDNNQKDFEIKDFVIEDETFRVDYSSLRTRGIDLHEMYSNDLPLTLQEADRVGIEQEFFILDIHEVVDDLKIKGLFNDTKCLKENEWFLHGLFGDQNVFGRGPTRYLPYKCQKISKKP